MHPYRGRGPSKAAAANVQCQKCLKRDESSIASKPNKCCALCLVLTVAERHYSYECKAAPQERPYIPRPSRTQQLFNPKLLPKLSAEVPNALQEKKGVADEELAKREAERARKREREFDEEARGRRSPSYDSVSTISTRSPTPPPRRGHSPAGGRRRPSSRSPSTPGFRDRRRSYDSGRRSSRGPSESPEHGYSARGSRLLKSPSPRRSVSPPPRRGGGRSRETGRYGSPGTSVRGRDAYARRSYSRSLTRSRSPARSGTRDDDYAEGRYRDREERGYGRRSPPPPAVPPQRPPPPPRERSLSPFSKRLALTQAMNRGR